MSSLLLITAALALQLADEPAEPAPVRVDLPPAAVTGPVAVEILFAVEAPRKVNAKAPRRTWIGERALRHKAGGTPVAFSIGPADIRGGSVTMLTEYMVCEDRDDAPCYRREVEFVLPVTATAPAAAGLRLRTPLFSNGRR